MLRPGLRQPQQCSQALQQRTLPIMHSIPHNAELNSSRNPLLCNRRVHSLGGASYDLAHYATLKPSLSFQKRAGHTVCRSSAAMMLDPADVIPDAVDEDDEGDEGRVIPSATRAVVIGAGPVGLITAAYLARRGYQVEVHEAQPHPAVSPRPHAEYPVLLTARAMLSCEELGMRVSFAGPSGATLHGTYDMAPAAGGAPVLAPARWNDKFMRTAVVGRGQLEVELLREVRRLYPGRVRVHYGSLFKRIEWDARAVVVERSGHLPGAPLHVESDRRYAGVSLSASAVRPPRSPEESDELLPELRGGPGAWEEEVGYGLLVGADGAESRVRGAMFAAKTRVRGFGVQRPLRDTDAWHTVRGLPVVLPSGQPAPIPGLPDHKPGEYLYEWGYGPSATPGAPRLRLYMAEDGTLRGLVVGVERWEAAALSSALEAAYGASLPAAWRDAIVQQTCGAGAAPPGEYPAAVQCTQFHGPRMFLVGDAAHAMSGELGQGISCAVEGVRVAHLALRLTNDNLERAPMVYDEVRNEDAHCMQQLEAFSRSLRPGVKWGDWVFAAGGCMGALVWRMALLTLGVLRSFMPQQFPATWLMDRLNDGRRGYSDVLKVAVRFAVGPVLVVLGVVAVATRIALSMSGRMPL